ncbi:MAG: ribosome maturation factor RimM [Dehalococcoidia bacterium]|nr:ribosome maturation factor RimM [Dehalococcoidia bacterium]
MRQSANGKGEQPLRPYSDEVRPGFVAIGRILTTRGVHGDLKVEPLAPDEAFVAGSSVAIRGGSFQIASSSRRARFLYVKLEGVDTPRDAGDLRGAYLQVPESDLAPLAQDSYYRFQLIGLAVRTTEGRDLGRIQEVLSTAANDVFVVTGAAGEVLLPATDDVIQRIDLEAGVVTIEVIPGLLP